MTAPAAYPPGLPGRRRTSVCRAGWRTVDDTGPGGPRGPHRTDHRDLTERLDRMDDVDTDAGTDGYVDGYVYVNYMVRLP